MKKPAAERKVLVQAVLASTLFVAPIVGQALDPINTPVTGPFDTFTDGDISITQTGRIASGPNDIPVTINSPDGKLSLLEGNNFFGPGTILPGADARAIDIVGTGTNAKIDFAPVTSVFGVTADVDVISVGGTGATINNAGFLAHVGVAGDHVVHIQAAGDNATLQNTNTGVITNAAILDTLSAVKTEAGSTGFVLDNQGLIQNLAIANIGTEDTYALEINGQFTSVNNRGQIIDRGLLIAADSSAGTVLLNPDVLSGDFVNEKTGLIGVGDWIALVANTKADTVIISGPMNDFVNKGVILNNTPNGNGEGGNALVIGDTATLNSLQNSGHIRTEETTDGADVIVGVAGSIITNGFTNTGDIIHTDISKNAINFSAVTSGTIIINSGNIVGNVLLATAVGGTTVLTNTGGTIAGVVTPVGAQADTLNVSGGTIVAIDGSAATASQTYNVSGGHITDKLKFQSGSAVNLSGDAFIGHIVNTNTDTVTLAVTGGDFDVFDGNNNALLRVDSTFKTDGLIINVSDVQIKNAGTVFTANNFITGIQPSSFDIDPGTTFVMNSVVSADPGSFAVVNVDGTLLVNTPNAVFDFATSVSAFNSVIFNNAGGIVRLGTEGILRISGNNDGSITGGSLFGNTANSTLNIQINGPYCDTISYGKMIVNTFDKTGPAVSLLENSYIQPQFTGFLPRGSTMDIITVQTGGNANNGLGGSVIDNDATLIPYPSAIVSFTPEVVVEGTSAGLPTGNPEFNSILRLTTNRNTFLSISSTDVTPGVAQVLDIFADSGCPPNNDIYTLLSNFDQIPSRFGVEESMQSLLPPFDYGLVEGSHIGMDSVFNAVTDRVFELSWNCKHNQIRFPNNNGTPANAGGQNAGDGCSVYGMWIRPIAAYAEQSTREEVKGYRAKGIGLAIGGDWGISDWSTVGLALSYTKVNVDDKHAYPKDSEIKSWQATVYGAHDFCYGLFLEGMVGYAYNDYDTERVIRVHSLLTTAEGSFNGNQWGFQVDMGWALPNCNGYFFAPFARIKYLNVGFDDYTESGAGGLNLHVSQNNAKEFMGAVGFKTASDFVACNVEWVPELTALVGYDFHNNGQQSVANFVFTDPTFSTWGVTPAKVLFDVAGALNAICGPGVITLKGNIEYRHNFFGSAAYLQYYTNWG